MADTDLGSFLKTRRALISPLDIGRPNSNRRRVTGLRRTEVAELAGISVEYYIELEQGRGKRPSEQVLAALSRALRLDRDEQNYLFGLVGGSLPPASGPTSHVDAALLDLLDKLDGTPAQLFTDLYELIAQNSLAGALLGTPEPRSGPQASVAYQWFMDPEARRRTPAENWAAVSTSYVSDLRSTSGRRPSDRRTNAFIRQLQDDSDEFSTLWSTGSVAVRRSGRHQVIHPVVGVVDLDCMALLSDDGSQRLVWYSPHAGSSAAEQLQLLGVVGEQFEPASGNA